MRLGGITSKQIVLAAIAILAIITGVIVFMNSGQEQTPPAEDGGEQTPDLVGTWQGTAKYTVDGVCAVQHRVRLVIKKQTDTKLTGTFAYQFKQDTPSGCFENDLGTAWSAHFAASADVSGSRLTNVKFGGLLSGLGKFSGSFTAAAIKLTKSGTHQFEGASYRLDSAIKLLRKE